MVTTGRKPRPPLDQAVGKDRFTDGDDSAGRARQAHPDRLRARYGQVKGGGIFDPVFARVAAAQFEDGDKCAWPFAGPATLLDAPFRPEAATAPDVGGLDIALVGVPMDLSVTNWAGGRLGPRAMRAVERIGPYEHRRHADIEAFHRGLVGAGVVPRSVGGGHSISSSILKAVGAARPVGMVHIDAHCDISGVYGGSKFHHGGPFREVVLDGVLDPRRVIQIGIRGGPNICGNSPMTAACACCMPRRSSPWASRRWSRGRAPSSARGRPMSPSTSTASIRALRRAPARPRSAA